MKNTKIVVCCGVFDGEIHPGHINFLRTAKRYGDTLYVFINPDSLIRDHKKREPICSQEERITNVAKTGIPHKVFPFEDNQEENIKKILELHPTTYCFGGDQISAWNQKLEENLGLLGIAIVRIPRYKPELYSTTKLIEMMQKKF